MSRTVKKKVFLSSVFTEFKDLRNTCKELSDEILEFIVLDNPVISSPNNNVLDTVFEKIAQSDYFVLLAGETYTSGDEQSPFMFQSSEDLQNVCSLNQKIIEEVLKGISNPISLTHIEYRYAKKLGKPIFVYYKNNTNPTNDFCQEILRDNKAVHYDTMMEELQNSNLAMAKNISLDIKHHIYSKLEFYHNKARILSKVDSQKDHFAIITHLESRIPSIAEIRKTVENESSIDQKYLYLSPEAVSGWMKWEQDSKTIVTTCGTLQSLEKLLYSEIWRNILPDVDTIIDLGVGAGEKTMKVIESLSDAKEPINLIPVDYSATMLDFAIQNISTKVYEQRLEHMIDIDGLKIDFMQLSKAKNLLHNSEKKRSVFMLLGGTIGNIDENDFLNELVNVCDRKDIFIVTVFLKGGQLPEYKNIVYSAFQYTLKDLGYKIQKGKKGKNRRGSVYTSGPESSDRIKDADDYFIMVNLHDMINNKALLNIDIAKTTRYDADGFDSFLKKFGFKSLARFKDDQGISCTFICEYQGNPS